MYINIPQYYHNLVNYSNCTAHDIWMGILMCSEFFNKTHQLLMNRMAFTVLG